VDTRLRDRLGAIRRVSLCLVVGLTGCVSLGRREPPQRYYVLGGDTLRLAAPPFPDVADVTVGVRRLKLASYLASSFLVVRRGPNQVGFSEFYRWGEPLGAGINRVVARSLVARGFRDAAVAPWPAQGRYDYLIQLDVARFEGLAPEGPVATEGEVHLLATWEIIRQQDGVVLAQGTTDYRRPNWTVGDYAGLVSMLDEGLEVLAADVTAGVVGLRGPR
jgi:uncharacterized lipoprotein YmbA